VIRCHGRHRAAGRGQRAVAEVTTAYFQQLGYMVKQVAGASEALELLGNDPKIDLVFSDILMPGGMTGLELGMPFARAIRRCRCCSRPATAAAQAMPCARIHRAAKPFDIAALERARAGRSGARTSSNPRAKGPDRAAG